MLGFVSVLVATAAAWAPGATSSVRLDTPILALAAGDWHGAAVAVAVTESDTRVLDANGGELARFDGAYRAAALIDLDEDGGGDLLLCGPAGVALVVEGRPFELVSTRCSALGARTVDHVKRVIFASDDAVYELVPDAGKLRRDLLYEGVASAVAGHGLSWAALTEDGVVLDGELPVDPGAVGLASGPLGLVWLVPGPPSQLGGARPSLVHLARRIANAEVGTLTWGDGPLAMWRPFLGDLAPVALPFEPAFAAFSGALCPTLWAVSPDQRQVTRIAGVCEAPAVAEDEPADVDAPAPAKDAMSLVVTPVDGVLRVPVTTPWSIMQVQVGAMLRASLDVADVRAARRRGGPPGLRLSSEGELTYQPGATDVGVWRVPVSFISGRRVYKAGFVLDVAPAGAATGLSAAAIAMSQQSARDKNKGSGGLGAYRVLDIGLGIAGGVSNNEPSWRTFEYPRTFWSGSPAVAATVAYGSPVWHATFGYAMAPLHRFAYGQRLGRDAGGVQVGVTRQIGSVRAGPYVLANFRWAGLGVRAVVPLRERASGSGSGLELRGAWLAGTAAMQAQALYTWSFKGRAGESRQPVAR